MYVNYSRVPTQRRIASVTSTNKYPARWTFFRRYQKRYGIYRFGVNHTGRNMDVRIHWPKSPSNRIDGHMWLTTIFQIRKTHVSSSFQQRNSEGQLLKTRKWINGGIIRVHSIQMQFQYFIGHFSSQILRDFSLIELYKFQYLQ